MLAQFGTATATTAKLTLVAILALAVVGLVVDGACPCAAERHRGRGGGRRLRALRLALPDHRRSDPGGLRQARRHGDLAGAHRPRLRVRAGAGQPGPLDPSAGDRRLPRRQLPDRRLRPGGADVEAERRGRGVHDPALDGLRRGGDGPAAAGAGAAAGPRRRPGGGDRDRGLARLAAGRLLPLGGREGDGRGGAAAAGAAAGRTGRRGRLAAALLGAAGDRGGGDARRARARRGLGRADAAAGGGRGPAPLRGTRERCELPGRWRRSRSCLRCRSIFTPYRPLRPA